MIQLSKPKAIITDMDGTIIDSEGFACKIWKNAGLKMGIDIPDTILSLMIGSSVNKTNSLFLEHYGADFNISELRKIKTEIEMDSYGKGLLKEKEGALDFLRFIASISLPLGLATTTEKYRALKRLDEINAKGFFNSLAFGDEVQNQKPDPEIYFKVANNLNVSIKDCLIVEDSISGVMAAIASGAKTVWIKDTIEIDEELKKQVVEYSSFVSLRADLAKLLIKS